MKHIPQLRPGDRRLVRGYGPLLLAVAVFLTITATVPTVAPQQNVALPLDGLAVDPVPGGASVTPPAAGATKGVGGQVVPGTVTAPLPTAGGPAPASAGASSCGGAQVKGDPYSPPCARFKGSNGGATSRGVSDTEIVITYTNPTDGSKSRNEVIANAIGGYNSVIFPETYPQMLATMQNLVTYFNTHFQFYGRKIVLKVIDGQQDYLGSNQSQVNADALRVAGSVKAFAEINTTNLLYVQALTRQRVMSFGNIYGSDQFYRRQAPYAWSTGPDCTQMAGDLGALTVKGLAGRPATWAGNGVEKSGARRFAVIAPDLPTYQECAATLIDTLKGAGRPPTTVIAYPFVAAQASSIAQNMTQRIINDRITTILCLCDPLSQLLVTNNLANADYLPEFFDAAVGGLETDVIAQQLNQDAWAHATTLASQVLEAGKYGSTLGYFAAKSVDPNAFIVAEVDQLYLQLYQLALGIQLAGPQLTPETFARGLHSYRGASGPYGPWSWTVGGQPMFTPAHQFRLQWWDRTAISSYDGEQGSWQVLPTWYRRESLPAAQPALFPHGIQ